MELDRTDGKASEVEEDIGWGMMEWNLVEETAEWEQNKAEAVAKEDKQAAAGKRLEEIEKGAVPVRLEAVGRETRQAVVDEKEWQKEE